MDAVDIRPETVNRIHGEDIENISAHLGHASSDITSRVYAHMYAEVRIRMAKTVSGALFEKNKTL